MLPQVRYAECRPVRTCFTYASAAMNKGLAVCKISSSGQPNHPDGRGGAESRNRPAPFQSALRAPAGFRIRPCNRCRIAHIAGRIFLLRIAQAGRTPVTRLLLFGNVSAEKFFHQFFQAVPVGEGPRQPRGDLGAEHRGCRDLQIIFDGREIEATEMEYFTRSGSPNILRKLGAA
jgi:hypothetical protein